MKKGKKVSKQPKKQMKKPSPAKVSKRVTRSTKVASPAKKAASSIKSTRSSSKAPAKKPVQKTKAKVQTKKKIVKKASTIQGYTPAQLKEYKTISDTIMGKSLVILKEELKANDQARSGAKGDLVAKIADGRLLGKIPRCPSCFGGRLRFSYKANTYECPGYHDDESFVNCGKVFKGSEVKREPWVKI